jgi:hypothetical protein
MYSGVEGTGITGKDAGQLWQPLGELDVFLFPLSLSLGAKCDMSSSVRFPAYSV